MYPGIIIKQKRQELGMTLEELSQQTSFSIGYLSKLERADSMPPLATLQKLAEVLNINMMELLNLEQQPSETTDKDIKINRRSKEPPHFEEDDISHSEALMSDYKNRAIVPFLLTVRPGETESFSHDAEEFLYILEGEILLIYKNKQYTLKKGDSAYLDSRKPHRFINQTNETVTILTANYIYRRF